MKVRPKPLGLRLPGVRAVVDALHRISLDVNVEGAQFERAFKSVAARCLDRRMDGLSPDAALVVTFIVTDAMADESLLERVWLGMRNAFSCKGVHYAYWTDSLGRTDCRVISSRTTLCVCNVLRQSETPVWQSVAREVESWMREAIGVQHLLAKRCGVSALTAVLRGAVAFWQRVPGIYHTHILGLQHMAPLPEASLMRLELGAALARPAAEVHEVDDPAERAIDASVARAIEFDLGVDSLIADRISDLMIRKVPGGYARQRREKIEGLLRLGPSVPPSDGHASLLLAAALHFLVAGTPEASSPSIRIVGAYVKDLHVGFSQLAGGLACTLTTDEDKLSDVYQPLIENNPHCRFLQSAIGAFHSFLVSRFGLAPVWVRGRRQDVPVIPNAEVLHDHEVARLLQEISESAANKRVRRFAIAMVQLALDVPIRIGDVLRLRIADVRGTFPNMFVDIRHRADDPREKAPATIRTVAVRSEQAAAALADVKSLRQGESISTRDRLFGDGFRMPTINDSTSAYALINGLIKQITGVRTIGFHVLRHTSVTRDVRRALLDRGAVLSWEALEACSARSGHASPVTCIVTYSHCWALPMRHVIDDVLDRLLTVRGVSRWCGISENALSKRRSRNDGFSVLRSAMRTAAGVITLRSVAAGMSSSDTRLSATSSQPVAIEQVLRVMEAIGNRASDTRIAESSGLREDVVVRIREEFHANRHGRPATYKRTHWQQRKWDGVLDLVRGETSSPTVQAALQSWRQCSRKGRLDARDSALLDSLLRFLGKAGLPAARLLLRSVDPDGEAATAVVKLVTAIFDGSPIVERVPKKKGRFGDYLYVISKAQTSPTRVAASAATSMRGLDAIFIAAAIVNALA
jgi:integrase